jgi:acetylornithine deacetylase/succinyl-diaminopimelate desuccinylase-like protein
MDDETLRQQVNEDLPRIIDDLSRLVAIPSIGYAGYDPSNVRASADLTRELLRDAGLTTTELWELDGGHPAVFGEQRGPESSPTVLLYAHHDVQPDGDTAAWTTPPFAPEVRDGRLFGRGAADDKAGIAIHAAALRAVGSELGCGVKVLVEGEEECSTEHLPQLIDGHADRLRADVAVIADGGNFRTGVPTIGTSVRGVTSCEVRVDVLPIAVHSGAFGGPLPDAISALARMIATLHDDAGDVTLRGLREFVWTGRPVTEEEFREETGVLPGVKLIGTGSIADRTLSRPAINVLAFEAPRIVDAANQIVPTARAIVGLRLAPGDDSAQATRMLADHLEAVAPWGVRVIVTPDEPGAGYLVDTSAPAYVAAKDALGRAFDAEVVEVGSGGSIPLVPMLARACPGIQILIVGASDHRSNTHSIDESVDLADLERMIVAEAMFLRDLGAGDRSSSVAAT